MIVHQSDPNLLWILCLCWLVSKVDCISSNGIAFPSLKASVAASVEPANEVFSVAVI